MTVRHGPEPSKGEPVSNLPWLEVYYKPGMYVSSIAALNDIMFDSISGLQVEMKLDGEEDPYLLPIVGVAVEEVKDWELQDTNLEVTPADKITILTSLTLGSVCDVIIY